MIIIKRIVDAVIYMFLNYFVAYIPSWTIRKMIYLIFGMKIEKGARIYMKCVVRSPWRIKIGENTIINECCYLDGRGSITIGKNTSISFYTTIISASHDSRSKKFDYIKEQVVIGDNVWIGARAIVLQGTNIRNQCVLAAGSTLKGKTEEGYIYAGIPAQKRKYRDLEAAYDINHYDFFR